MGAGVIDRALHPVNFLEIDAVFVLQQPADEDRRRHGVERHADALALQILAVSRMPDFRLMAMKPWRKQREGKTGRATNGHCLLAKRCTNSELEYSATSNSCAARHAVEDRPRFLDRR